MKFGEADKGEKRYFQKHFEIAQEDASQQNERVQHSTELQKQDK
jgi:hypothetical protein